MTSFSLRTASPAKTRADVVVVGVVAAGKGGKKGPQVAAGGEDVASAYGRRFAPLLATMGVTGKAGEAVRVPSGGAIKAPTLLLVGLGDANRLGPTQVRRAAGVAARNLGNAASVALALPTEDATGVRAVMDGFISGGYTYAGLKQGRKKKDDDNVAEVAVLSPAARQQESVAAFETAQVVGRWADLVRDLVNTPPNLLRPTGFAEQVAALSKGRNPKVKATVLDEAELADLGCGGILGVGQGSDDPPRLVRLEYRPKDATGHVALVGKGITYDSGGLTIKPGGSMATMKNDMAGAATVVAAIHALAELDVPVAVTAYAPMAENMISGRALRPGDVLTMYGGTTVEVRNTDAEGRLVLADALAMAAETDVDAIVEVSTLTGPCVTALGDRIAGLFGDEATMDEVDAAAEATGELLWRLPLLDEMKARVRSESQVADVLQHNWVRWGSASWAAAFLTMFVGDKPFAHVDMAGPAWNGGGPWGHVPAGATGFAVPTLVEWVRSRAAS